MEDESSDARLGGFWQRPTGVFADDVDDLTDRIHHITLDVV